MVVVEGKILIFQPLRLLKKAILVFLQLFLVREHFFPNPLNRVVKMIKKMLKIIRLFQFGRHAFKNPAYPAPKEQIVY